MLRGNKVRDDERVLAKCKHIYNIMRQNLALLAPNTDSQRVRRIYLAPILHPSCTQTSDTAISFRL